MSCMVSIQVQPPQTVQRGEADASIAGVPFLGEEAGVRQYLDSRATASTSTLAWRVSEGPCKYLRRIRQS
jgi:hypothetical protein